MTERPEVEVFTQRHCAACRQVERFLMDRGVAFTARDVGEDAHALEKLTDRGYMSTPVTRIGDRWISGFNRKALEQALA